MHVLILPTENHVLSIPAWFDWRLCRYSDLPYERQPFNPSLVRLAPSPRCRHARWRDRFQSQLGSIGAWVLRQADIAESLFQSQLGSIGAAGIGLPLRVCFPLSIPAWFDWREIGKRLPGARLVTFNPSLVRLARGQTNVSQLVFSTFNPSLVRLAPGRRRPLPPQGHGLSIPAWFDWRMPWTPQQICCAICFQSQLGSIGAHHGPAAPEGLTTLSIPAWFDWRRSMHVSVHTVRHLSIPAWFDWRGLYVSSPWRLCLLSIPAWFDWRLRPCWS